MHYSASNVMMHYESSSEWEFSHENGTHFSNMYLTLS